MSEDTDQAWYWAPEWQAGERQADEDIAAGRGRVFLDEAEFSAYLDEIPFEQPNEQGGPCTSTG